MEKPTEEQDYLPNAKFTNKQKKNALKHLQKSRKGMVLFRGKQASNFIRRAVVKHRRRMVQQLKDGTSLQIYMID